MSEELLAKVLAKPADDAARAAYAAALHKAGDPRGEFIDLQCDLAKHKDHKTPAAKKLAKRIAELHKKHAAKWAKPLRALGDGTKWELKRGFVERLEVVGEPRMAALNDVFAIEPVTDLITGGRTAWLKSLFASAGMWRVERLVLQIDFGQAKAVIAELTRATLPNLVELRMGVLKDQHLEGLGEVAPPKLVHLCVGGVGITEKGVGKLLDSPLGRKLETLELDRFKIDPRMANLICATQIKRFSASDGWVDEVEDQLKARFGKNFVVEDEESFDYLLYGTKGISR
ncbi:MAG TPA: TIGR02996 domain-containing protein [Kofleriaceae bacterium]|nr:TIGR02996 domain-containing protein [Kofleriaceae bacterium]